MIRIFSSLLDFYAVLYGYIYFKSNNYNGDKVPEPIKLISIIVAHLFLI